MEYVKQKDDVPDRQVYLIQRLTPALMGMGHDVMQGFIMGCCDGIASATHRKRIHALFRDKTALEGDTEDTMRLISQMITQTDDIRERGSDLRHLVNLSKATRDFDTLRDAFLQLRELADDRFEVISLYSEEMQALTEIERTDAHGDVLEQAVLNIQTIDDWDGSMISMLLSLGANASYADDEVPFLAEVAKTIMGTEQVSEANQVLQHLITVVATIVKKTADVREMLGRWVAGYA